MRTRHQLANFTGISQAGYCEAYPDFTPLAQLHQGVRTPRPRAFLHDEVKTAFEMGSSNLENDTLLREAEQH